MLQNSNHTYFPSLKTRIQNRYSKRDSEIKLKTVPLPLSFRSDPCVFFL
ncbi:hypothetical protein LEP1GSC161_1650 [Leptospira santarosai str. CBC1416]|uniref:Uncharacterized protein n=2 Tax=Leptospira santarosai TaxID=28183 RepID=M6JLR4_9LEPT|nr:hypothetical protein LEP1GSC063_1741 [Leptospira santarosai serovar Arenal str. MAVJ 401]EMO12224.1 hypothetical protein LEP1GSC165_3236 [Leptospira santarosai str. CBC523]EMO60075.1 hypothetical protein LEP1GSC161_1650 [Leptospira santarosai str. CBC1416]